LEMAFVYILHSRSDLLLKNLESIQLIPEPLPCRVTSSGELWQRQESASSSDEIDLPEGLNPETVTCSMTPDGKLHIEAPNTLLSSERVVPINCNKSPNTKTTRDLQTTPFI
uniref:SHSP domain-containing protein n=1 Tax=Esox lucius TaxID=8010 RepID=A0AAY5KYM9_ESOLU